MSDKVQTDFHPYGKDGKDGKDAQTSPFNIVYPNMKIVSIKGSNLANGENIVYTVPVGRKALFRPSLCDLELLATTNTNTSCYPFLKISGVNFRPSNSATSLVNGNNAYVTLTNGPFILDAGDSLGLNVTGTNGVNLFGQCIEFDDTFTSIQTIKLTSLVMGANTVFTVPVGKTYVVGLLPVYLGSIVPTNLQVWNTNLYTINYHINFVSSGESPTINNQVLKSLWNSLNAGATGIYVPYSFQEGDSLVLTTSAAGASILTWITVIVL